MNIMVTDLPDKRINDNMIGLFFEDINYGLDGGHSKE